MSNDGKGKDKGQPGTLSFLFHLSNMRNARIKDSLVHFLFFHNLSVRSQRKIISNYERLLQVLQE